MIVGFRILSLLILAAVLLAVMGIAAAPRAAADDDIPLPHGAVARFEPKGLRIGERATAIALSASGQLVAAGAADGLVHVYDARNGKRIRRLENVRAAITGLTFADEGRELVATTMNPKSTSGSVLRWLVSVPTPNPPQIYGKNDPFVFQRAMGQKRLATVQANQVEVRELDSREPILKTPAVASVWMPVVSRDSSLLAFGVGTANGSPTKVEIWEVDEKKRRFQLEGPAENFTSLYFSADNKRFFGARSAGNVMQWDLQTGKPLAMIELPAGRFGVMRPSPDSKQLFIGTTDGELIQFDVETGKALQTIDLGRGAIQVIDFSADGTVAACGGAKATIHVIDVASGKDRFPTKGVAVAIQGLAADGDQSQLAVFNSTGNETMVALLDGKTGEPTGVIERPGNFLVQQLAYSPRGRFAAASTSQTGLLLWDTSNPRDRVVLGAFNPGRYVAAASSTAQLGAEGELTGEIIVSPLVGEKEGVIPHLARWQAHEGAVTQMRFSADGKRFASCGLDKTIAVWTARGGERLFKQTLNRQPLKCLALTKDGGKLALVVDAELQIWEVDRGEKLIAAKVAGDPVTVLEFTSDGQGIVVGDGTGVLRAYDAATIKLTGETTAHQGEITALLAAVHENSIVSGGDDGVVHVWDAASLEKRKSFYPNRSPVVGLAFSKSGEFLGVATERFGGWCWRFNQPEKPLVSGVTSLRPLAVAFTEKGEELVTVSDRRIIYRSAIASRRAAPPSAGQFSPPTFWPAGNFNGLAFSPDGNYIAAPLAEGVGLWDVSTGVLRNVFPIERNIAHAVAISPDGRWMAAGGLGIALWDLNAEKLVAKIPANESDEVFSLAFSPNSRLLAAGGKRESRVWNVAARRMASIIETGLVQLGQLGFTADGYGIVALASPPAAENPAPGMPQIQGDDPFAPRARSPRTLPRTAPRAGLQQKRIAVWEIVSGSLRFELAEHPPGLASAFVSHDGALLYTGSNDGAVFRWDLAGLLAEQETAANASASIAQLWQDLGSDDVAAAYRAIRGLAEQKEAAVSHIAASLEPASAAEEDVDRLIANLGSPLSSERRDASERLRRAGSTAWPKMQAALAAEPSPAVRTRLELLLAARIGAATSEQIRAVRAVQVLARIGGGEARETLKRLAGGLPGAPLTDAAQAALSKR